MKNNGSHGLTMKYGIFTKKNGSQTMRTGVFTMKNEVFTIKHGVLTTKNGDYHQNRDFPDKYSDLAIFHGSHSFASTPSSYRGCIKLLKIQFKKITLSGITKHHFTSFCLVLKVLTQTKSGFFHVFPRFFHVFSTFFQRFFHVFSFFWRLQRPQAPAAPRAAPALLAALQRALRSLERPERREALEQMPQKAAVVDGIMVGI